MEELRKTEESQGRQGWVATVSENNVDDIAGRILRSLQGSMQCNTLPHGTYRIYKIDNPSRAEHSEQSVKKLRDLLKANETVLLYFDGEEFESTTVSMKAKNTIYNI